MKKKIRHVNTKNARSADYRQVLEAINKGGFCPFCEENLMMHHRKPIHWKTKYWIVTENSWPYDATRHHFLIIYRPKHICHLNELSAEAILDKLKIEQKICRKYKVRGGSVLMRFGSSHDTGASVEHIHFHIVVPDKKHKKYNPKKGVIARLG